MKAAGSSPASRTLAPLLIAIFVFAGGAWAENVIHQFKGQPNDGGVPLAGLTYWKTNYYGTASIGGLNNYGAVVVLTPPSSLGGTWTETVLYSFQSGNDGQAPRTRVIFDSQGNLYGTTWSGGTYGTGGTVFELTPPATLGGSWTESVLHSFGGATNGPDGWQPSGVILGLHGALYGTTYQGGGSGWGTIFMLGKAFGSWRESVLHSFTNANGDGGNPAAALIADKAGNLYGTTSVGGPGVCAASCGIVFELSPPAVAGGEWTETILYSFTGANGDGANPQAGLVMDSAGNLYGTTYYGGSGQCISGSSTVGCGVIFELSPPSSGGSWTEHVLYSFTGGSDGEFPHSELVFDKSGNLYGTATEGGRVTAKCGAGCGTVFKLSPSSGGTWTETTLYEFEKGTDDAIDGINPQSGLILSPQGVLYGTTPFGYGTSADGTVFAVRP